MLLNAIDCTLNLFRKIGIKRAETANHISHRKFGKLFCIIFFHFTKCYFLLVYNKRTCKNCWLIHVKIFNHFRGACIFKRHWLYIQSLTQFSWSFSIIQMSTISYILMQQQPAKVITQLCHNLHTNLPQALCVNLMELICVPAQFCDEIETELHCVMLQLPGYEFVSSRLQVPQAGNRPPTPPWPNEAGNFVSCFHFWGESTAQHSFFFFFFYWYAYGADSFSSCCLNIVSNFYVVLKCKNWSIITDAKHLTSIRLWQHKQQFWISACRFCSDYGYHLL